MAYIIHVGSWLSDAASPCLHLENNYYIIIVQNLLSRRPHIQATVKVVIYLIFTNFENVWTVPWTGPCMLGTVYQWATIKLVSPFDIYNQYP